MKYYKFIYFLSILIVFLVIKIVFLKPSVKVVIEKDKIVFSTATAKIPLKVFANRDSIFSISFYIEEKKIKQKVFTDYVIALRKGQDYDLVCELNEYILKEKNFFLFLTKVKELLPYKKEYFYSTFVKKTVAEVVEKVVSEPVSTTVNIVEEKKPLKEEKVVSKYKEEKIVVKEKPDFEIIISSEEIKKKYNYDEKIKLSFFVKNKTSTSQVSPKINAFLKTKSNVIVSSQTFNIKLMPLETRLFIAKFDVLKDYFAGSYYIELNGILDDKRYVVCSEEFEIIDTPPKVSLPEMPVIRYKLSNTILAEVEDDKEVVEVKLIEVIPKKKPPNEYQVVSENQMILVAGNKKAGLYSYTTPKILKKGFYAFYISTRDSSDNITTTEVFKVKIIR